MNRPRSSRIARVGRTARQQGRDHVVRVVDLVLCGSAIASIILGFVRWATEMPDLHPVAVIGLLSVPFLVRLSASAPGDGFTRLLGLAPAVLFAGSFVEYSHLLPAWAVLVLASHLVLRGGIDGLPEGSMIVLAGTVLVVVAPYGDFGVRPYDRALVAIPAYLAALLVLYALRYWATSLDGRPRDLRTWTHIALMVAGLAFASLLFGVLRLLYTEPDLTSTAMAALLFLALLVVAVSVVIRVDDATRGTRVLQEASSAMHWPADEIGPQLLDWAARAVRADESFIGDAPGGPKDISARIDEHTWVVLRRRRGDLAFTAGQRRIIGSLAAMAAASAEHARREEQLRRQVITDDLTGLWTYAHFLEQLGTEIADRGPDETLTVLFLDLDGFKAVNEAFGHLEADQVLREISGRLRDRMAPGALCARYGGDEFLLVVRDAESETEIAALVRHLEAMVGEPVAVAGQLVRIGVTVGHAVSYDVADDAGQLVRNANEAMRRGKVQPDRRRLNPQWVNELAVLRELINDGRLEVAYQPVVDLRTGTLHGCEALLRADGQEFGTLSPLTVVRAAERLRLLDELTEAVADQAIPFLDRISARVEVPLTLSLNVEFEQLRTDNRFIESLGARMRGAGFALTLELSERSFVRWEQSHTALAEQLRTLGVGLAIDDFGAGYATFTLVNQWDWAWVKIDRCLVSGPANPRRKALLPHVTAMLTDLAMPAVAEGIESAAHRDRVAELGVPLGQGMYLGPPVSAAVLEAELELYGVRRPDWLARPGMSEAESTLTSWTSRP